MLKKFKNLHLEVDATRWAFTLAEVLITLAVIGIVAALTIPGLVKNHNEKAWLTAKDTFTKKLEVAMKVMNTEETLTGYSTTEDFVNALKKNIKITKVCADDVTKCFSKEIVWNSEEAPVSVAEATVEFSTENGQEWAELVGVQFANGITALLAYNKNCTSDPFNNQYSPSNACIGMIYDVQGHKMPNSFGKDVHAQNVDSVDTQKCAFKLNDVCYQAPKTLYSLDGNYWNSAIELCGGLDNIMDVGYIIPLIKEIYGVDFEGVTSSTTKSASANLEKALSFGLPALSGSTYWIWAKQRSTASVAEGFNVNTNSVHFNAYYYSSFTSNSWAGVVYCKTPD